MKKLSKGTSATRDFYDKIGWRRQGGELVDTALFGLGDGPYKTALKMLREERVLAAAGGPGLAIAELGCGGTPAVFLARRAAKYTAVDFSSTGLKEAAKALEAAGTDVATVEVDITSLPFGDHSFDVVYSSHAIYHIDTVEGQEAALSEAMRVLRPGGTAIFILGNPYPLLFPYRALRRVLAATPGLSQILNRLRKKPPLPFLPMPLGWTRKVLEKWGEVTIIGHGVSSVAFDHRVSDRTALGRCIWSAIHWLERDHPGPAARLGLGFMAVVKKRA